MNLQNHRTSDNVIDVRASQLPLLLRAKTKAEATLTKGGLGGVIGGSLGYLTHMGPLIGAAVAGMGGEVLNLTPRTRPLARLLSRLSSRVGSSGLYQKTRVLGPGVRQVTPRSSRTGAALGGALGGAAGVHAGLTTEPTIRIKDWPVKSAAYRLGVSLVSGSTPGQGGPT